MSKVKPIPEGFHTVTPYLTIKDAANALQFYQAAFGAQVIERHDSFGKVMHATIKIGDSLVMLSDEFPEYSCGLSAPSSLKGTTVALHLYVEDVDAFFDQALKAGAKSTMPVADAFWGDRHGQLEDPFGHRWAVSTHKEDLTPEEIENRSKECMASDCGCPH